eukprot:scaffold2193_cov179-Ochromonas_danica.AAC.30
MPAKEINQIRVNLQILRLGKQVSRRKGVNIDNSNNRTGGARSDFTEALMMSRALVMEIKKQIAHSIWEGVWASAVGVEAHKDDCSNRLSLPSC